MYLLCDLKLLETWYMVWYGFIVRCYFGWQTLSHCVELSSFKNIFPIKQPSHSTKQLDNLVSLFPWYRLTLLYLKSFPYERNCSESSHLTCEDLQCKVCATWLLHFISFIRSHHETSFFSWRGGGIRNLGVVFFSFKQNIYL